MVSACNNQKKKQQQQQSINMKSPFLASLLENMCEKKFSPEFPLCHLLQPYDVQPWNRQSKRFWDGSQSSLGPKSDFWIFFNAALTSTHIKASLVGSPSTHIYHTHSKRRWRSRASTLRARQPAGSLLSPQREGPVLTAHKYKYRIMKQQETALQE